MPRFSHDRAHLHAAHPHARVCMPPRFGGRRCAVSHVVAHTYWLRRGASPYRVSVHLLHSGGHLRWSDLPRVPTPCGRSVRRHHDGWGKPALWPACSQNESGGPIILRKARRWRWACAVPLAVCACPTPFLFPSPARSTQRQGCAWLRGEPCGTKIALSQSRYAPVSQAQRRRVSRGQEAPLLHDTQPGLQHIPYSHTAPGYRLGAVSEACLCDGTFSQLLSAYWS